MSDDDKKERDDGLTEQAARAYADEVARLQGRIAELLREQDAAKKKQEEKEQEMARLVERRAEAALWVQWVMANSPIDKNAAQKDHLWAAIEKSVVPLTALYADAQKQIDAWEHQRKAEEERDALAAKLDQLRRNRDENIAEVRRLDNEIGIAKVNRITLIIERDDAIARAEKAEEEQRALREVLVDCEVWIRSLPPPFPTALMRRINTLLTKETS